MAVTGVGEVDQQMEIEVELVGEVACCRRCGRAAVFVKDRPVVRVRDLSIASRLNFLRWRKRRFWCEACERTFTGTHPALPSRQRVGARFRSHLFDRVRDGGAHAEVARDEPHQPRPGLQVLPGRRR
jgi:transposase